MNTATKIISAAAVALLAAAGAHAEEYQGVLTVNSQVSRAEVSAAAASAAKAGANLYGDAAQAGVTQVAGNVDREAIRAQAVAASHDPTWNLDRKAFVNSTIPAQYTNGSLAIRRQASQNQASL